MPTSEAIFFILGAFGLALGLLAIDAIRRQRRLADLHRTLDQFSDRLASIEEVNGRLMPRIHSGPLAPDSRSVLNLIPPARVRTQQEQAELQYAFDAAIEVVKQISIAPPLVEK
jgi:hypothetical protein